MVYHPLSLPLSTQVKPNEFPMAQLLLGLKAQVKTVPLPTIAPQDLEVIITDVGIVV